MNVRSAFAEGQGIARLDYLERQWAEIHKKPTLAAIRRMARELGRLFPDAGVLDTAALVAKTKRADYTNGGDKFANFRTRAAELKCPIFLVWSVYAGKHLDALRTWSSTRKLESEPVLGRVVDLLNYLDLLEGMIMTGVMK